MSEAGLDEESERPPGAAPAREPGMLRRALAAISDLLMPPVCLVCRTPIGDHDALCAGCWRDIDFIRPPLCDRLGLPMPFDTGGVMISAAAAADPPPFDRARAIAAHTGSMRALVHALKFHDRHDVRRLLGKWLVEAGRDVVGECETVVPVPLARRRLLVRRFNQAAILAQEVARLTGLGYEPLALERRRATLSQVGLTRAARQRNVAGAFAVPRRLEDRVRGRKILLIDDVITTGSTVGACARALKRAGASRVDVLALALVTDRGVIPS
ncbi:ComF family protein [Hyphomicrobium sp. DMF-1]|uniref:ComF family protein n=1 Tax=Hyphomicrobium sp. DMF-1 TaxID=3019544 RepID=UPI0022EBEB9D|nr:ComF family protein [Hyphomicrobium sp. DMF-1]WBT38316.1 ComF family protein [Hyphomicrobium sp. DMF-1]